MYRPNAQRRFSPVIRILTLFLLLLLSAATAQAAAPSTVRKDAFLSRLLAVRGFETRSSAAENAATVLKSGIVTDAVTGLNVPVTRKDALRWMIQSLGLSAEAEILSHLDLPFKDAASLTPYEQGCLVVATRMQPPLFTTAQPAFGPAHKISPNEAQALHSRLAQASKNFRLEVKFSPAPGMEMEIFRQGTFSGIPKWRVHVYGFDEKSEAEELQRYIASRGLKTEIKNPNYEWSLRSDLLEDYALARRLAVLARQREKKAWIFPAVSNLNLENQPLYWAFLTMDPARFAMAPIIAPEGVTALAPLSSMVKNGAVSAAINGGFFAVSGRNKGVPVGALRIERDFVNKPYQGRTCLGWNGDNRAAFGELGWSGVIRLPDGWMSLDALNHSGKGNVLALFNAWYGRPTPTGERVTEVLVKDGKCIAVTSGGGTVIEPGTSLLVGYGTNAALLSSQLNPGDEVFIEDIHSESEPHWAAMDNVIQAGPLLVREGEIRIESEGFSSSIINLRHPRSVIGLTEDGKWVFFVGDGRNGLHSAGFTLQEVAGILKTKNIAYALNLDGGGSSQLMVGDRLFNLPSDGRERPVSYGIGAKKR